MLNFSRLLLKKNGIDLLNRLQTLEYIINKQLSISRFGDGECMLMFENKDLYFQTYNPKLAEQLREVLVNSNNNLLAAFNNSFALQDEYKVILDYERGGKRYNSKESAFETDDIGILHRPEHRIMYENYLKKIKNLYKGKILGDATVFFLGFYYDEYVNNKIDYVLELYKKLFADKKILFVCPKNPVIEPSFKKLVEDRIISCKNYGFIEVPNKNSYDYYEKTLREILKLKNFDSVMIQSGPMATVLAYELSVRHGIHSLDVGSLNVSLYKAYKKNNYTF